MKPILTDENQPGLAEKTGRLRVLFFANCASIHTIRWANAMTLLGVDIEILSFEPPKDSLHPGVRVHHPPILNRYGYFLNVPWVRRLVKRLKPDLVHAHYASGYGTLALLTGFHPTIVSVWGRDVYKFATDSILKGQLMRLNLSHADCVLSTSHAMARHTRQFTNKAIQVTPFGVDMARFRAEAQTSLVPRATVIGTVKAFEETYGIEYLLRAFALVKQRQPGAALKLLIVGGGSLREKLWSLACELSISDQTVFAGPVPHDEVPRYLNMLDIYVAPSVSESFGVAVIEASACERSVVVSDVGGLPEVVENGVTGFVVEPRNPVALAAAIERLVLKPALRKQMGQAGRERVARLYDWNSNVEQMLSIYQKVTETAAPKTVPHNAPYSGVPR